MARLVTARATVNLERFPVGTVAQVDPDDPRTAALLRSGLLVSDEWWDEPPPAVREPRKPNPPTQPDAVSAIPTPIETDEEPDASAEPSPQDSEAQTETPGPHGQ